MTGLYWEKDAYGKSGFLTVGKLTQLARMELVECVFGLIRTLETCFEVRRQTLGCAAEGRSAPLYVGRKAVWSMNGKGKLLLICQGGSGIKI